MLAREKQDLMKAEFESWLFRDPERRAKYVTLYNEKEEYEKVFPYEEVLKQKLARQKELNEELDLENKVSKEAESEKEKKVVPLFPKR